jgi:hypothetical protein
VSTGVIVILYGHLLFSAAIIWYFHSLRGYVSMMFFSFFIFCRIHEAIKNPKLVEIAREEAKTLVEQDPVLKNHPELLKKIEEREKVHME